MRRKKNYKKVVFIGDDKELIGMYNSVLEPKNLAGNLICFENAGNGINYLKKSNQKELPDYILLNLHMPVMDGFEFLKRFDKMGKIKNFIEVYVCTSSVNKNDSNKVMKYPFVNALVEKPLPGEFIELLIKDEI